MTEPARDIDALHANAREHYLAGRFRDAIETQLQIVNAHVARGEAVAPALRQLAFFTSRFCDLGGDSVASALGNRRDGRPRGLLEPGGSVIQGRPVCRSRSDLARS